VSRAILIVNVAVFALQVLHSQSTHALAQIPARTSLAFGANYDLATIAEARYETLVTACFLHGSLMHIGFNMLALWQAGPIVERGVGSARMAPMYLVSGIASSLTSTLVHWFRGEELYSVGASGAIAGVIAAALVLGWRVQGWRGALTQTMVRWLGFTLLFGILANVGANGARIDNAAHIGGAIAGGVIAALWRRGYRYSMNAERAILAVCAFVVVGCAAVVGARDLGDKYVMLTLEERVRAASDALRDRDCPETSRALHAAARLAPRAARTTDDVELLLNLQAIDGDYRAYCQRER
jgi:rhomboid protease GluP